MEIVVLTETMSMEWAWHMVKTHESISGHLQEHQMKLLSTITLNVHVSTLHWPQVPRFVVNDYFCDTAYSRLFSNYNSYSLQSSDPLWDGKGCGPTNTCCSFNSRPLQTRNWYYSSWNHWTLCAISWAPNNYSVFALMRLETYTSIKVSKYAQHLLAISFYFYRTFGEVSRTY